MKKKGMVFVFLANLVFSMVVQAGGALRVTFINPGFANSDNPTGGFWLSASSAMRAAADDLDIQLEILYSDRNHIKTQRIAQNVLARSNPPDFLLIVNEKLSAEHIIKAANNRGVNVLTVFNSLTGKQQARMGNPRGLYKHWLGSLIPDNYYAGYQSGKRLIDHALVAGGQAEDGYLYLLGYAGDFVTPASTERVRGLQQAVAEYPKVILQQVVPCYWSRENAKSKTLLMLKRYPKTGAIWSANDPIGLGAIEGAVAVGKQPGKNIFFSGLNWDPQALAKIKQGEMVVSMGGHFMTGAWALVMIYDYHHGHDFIVQGSELKYQIFSPIDKDNIGFFENKFSNKNIIKIDFGKFSKALQPTLRHYNFSLNALAKQP